MAETPSVKSVAQQLPPMALGARLFTRCRGRTYWYWRAPYALRREPGVMSEFVADARRSEQTEIELFNSSQELAHLQGYVNRALEDDAMRELGPIRDAPVPQPAPSPMSRRHAPASAFVIERTSPRTGYGEPPTLKPWIIL